MIPVSFSVRLHLDVSSNRALSLPQSFVAAKRRQKPAPSSEGAEAAPPQSTELQRCKPRLSPPLAGCPHPSRCSAARSTAPPSPRGRLRRRSKAKPLRGSRDSRSVRLCGRAPSKCAATRGTPQRAQRARFMRRSRASCAEGTLHTPKGCFICSTHVPSFSRFLRLKAGVEIPEKQTERQ